MTPRITRVIAISVNHDYANNFTGSDGEIYNINNRLTVPAASYKTVTLDMSDFISPNNIAMSDPIRIELTTSYINYFSHTYIPPVANMKLNVEAENLGTTTRDYLMLDGSGSSSNDSTILSWVWNVTDLNTHISTKYIGKMVRVTPQSNGPFSIGLTVIDDVNLTGSSYPVTVPFDPNFVPAKTLTAANNSNYDVTATVLDAAGMPVSGVIVDFTLNNPNIPYNRYTNITDASGHAIILYMGDHDTIGNSTLVHAYLDTDHQKFYDFNMTIS